MGHFVGDSHGRMPSDVTVQMGMVLRVSPTRAIF
jgi:hypothetical protein